MGRLFRLLLAALARGLRAVAGRLAPSSAPVAAVAPAEPAADAADGPPGHWLAMVRTRAPGLHLSLQERGVIDRRAVSPARPLPAAAPASALEPRRSAAPRPPVPTPSARPVALTASRPPVAAPAVPVPDSDLLPHGWRSAVADEREEWTRVTTRRCPAATAPAGAATPLGPADAVVAQVWRPPAAPPVAPPYQPPTAEPRRADTRPGLRPVPVLPARDTDRHTAATPVFAPSRDEDALLHRTVPPRRSWPTPTPTPWRIEALQAPVEDLARTAFPPLPDEAPGPRAPASTTPRAPAVARPLSPSRPPRPVRPHEEVGPGAWPSEARVPALRPSPPDDRADGPRWPDLMDDDDGHDGLALPEGHRERLAREQRGLSWNG